MCLAGPGNYRVTGNRLVAGGIAGIVTSGLVGLPLANALMRLHDVLLKKKALIYIITVLFIT